MVRYEAARYYEQDMRHEYDKTLEQRYFGFPDTLTYSEFRRFSPELRQELLLRNPILETDTYNRTMEQIAGSEWNTDATYALQFRKARHGYLIAAGVEDVVMNIANVTVTQNMIDFAKDYYDHMKGIGYFNPAPWQEVVDQYEGKLPFQIDAVRDGTAVLPGDPVLSVRGPNELVVHFEPEFHQAFYQTLVATNAHEIAEKIGANRFIEVGLRGETPAKHMDALKAMYIGGGLTMTSSDMASGISDRFVAVGTIGHRYVQKFKEEETAFRKAIETLDSVTLLVDLNDTYNGIEIALKLKKEYRDTNKKIWIRLDSGDITDQMLYGLRRQAEEGMIDPTKDKIVVESVESLEEMVAIDEAIIKAGFSKDFVLYGAGGLLISKNTARSDASTGFKLTRYDSQNTMKFSDTLGKQSIPGEPILVTINNKRVIAQQGEHEGSKGSSLFVPMYHNGDLLISPDMDGARRRADETYATIVPLLNTHSELSDKTMQMIDEIRSERHMLKETNGGTVFEETNRKG